MTTPRPTRRTLTLFVLGVVAFTVYGSLVPFEFRSRTPADVTDAFRWAMTRRPLPESRSDGLANVLLGVPLGFGLLGLVRLDRPGAAPAVAAGVLLLPLCLAFAAAVEFAQLYVPERTCAGSDVLCQGVGAAIGMAVWVLFGQRLIEQAREVAGSGAVSRLLVGYVVLLAFVQMLPMDLTLSPKEIYKKLRDRVQFVPFGEFRGASADQQWDRTATLLRVTALYLPVGLLAANLSGRARRYADGGPKVLALAVGLACGMEAIQLVVHSRFPSATDVVVGAATVTYAWAVARWCAGGSDNPSPTPPLGREGLQTLGTALLLGAAWVAAVMVICWHPFALAAESAPFDWMPGLPREGKNDLFALEQMLTKLAIFAPFGVLASWVAPRRRLLAGAVAGLVAAAVFEAGQMVFSRHYPGITDVVLGGVGAVAGAWAAVRVRSAGGGSFRPGVY